MIRRRIGLHGKFVSSLLVAAALPFFICLIFIETLGYRYMLERRGAQHQVESMSLLAAICQAANAEGDKLRAWLVSEPDLEKFVATRSHAAEALASGERIQQTQILDEIWSSLPENDPKVQAVTGNQVADALRRYESVHSTAAELLIADTVGRLVVASQKSTDYNQADEHWWQRGMALKPGEFWRDAVQFDESIGVFTIDLVLPIFHGDERVGVIKMAVEVSRLVPHLIMRGIQTDSTWFFVLRSGHILISSDASLEPLKRRMPFELLNEIRNRENGWTIAEDHQGEESIIGFTAFHADYIEPNAYIVFSSLSSSLFEPLWGNFIGLAMAGISLLGLCLLVGFFLIQRKVLRPLSRIEAAVRSLSMLARLRKQGEGSKRKLLEQHQRVEDHLRDIQKIRTGDQIEVLSREIATMISRVLNYQSELEKRDAGEEGGAANVKDDF